MLYRAKKFEDASQPASYAGRVSFGTKEVSSAGVLVGDVSLKLVNVTIEDAGDYSCYVSSEQVYESATVRLVVMGEYHESGGNTQNQRMVFTLFSQMFFILFVETGTPVFLSAVPREDNMVNVSCESEGWYPEPSLRWSDGKQVLTPKSLKHSADSSGLLSVRSWLLVSSSSEVSCSVGLSGEEAKEARVRVYVLPPPGKQSKEDYLHVCNS